MKNTIAKYWKYVPNKVQAKINNIFDIDHEIIYSEGYFEFVNREASKSSPVIAESIVETFTPSEVLDVGCGTGALLRSLKNKKVNVLGMEKSKKAIKMCKKKGVDVIKFDIVHDKDPFPERKFDIVTSMEVAEHIPESASKEYLNLLCRHSQIVIFTAAVPGQGGKNHLNEQPHRYWIERFENRGYSLLNNVTKKMKKKWQSKGVTSWYHKNLMIFSNDHSNNQ